MNRRISDRRELVPAPCHPERSAAARSRGTATKPGDCSAPPSSIITAVPRLRAYALCSG
jgi:hypothetical protein